MKCFEERLVIQLAFVFKTMFKTKVKTMFKTVFKTEFKIMFEPCSNPYSKKRQNISYKNMAFLKITDLKKRDFIVNEYLKTRLNIQHKLSPECVGDLSTQYELSKLFKPVTDMHKRFKRRSCKRTETN